MAVIVTAVASNLSTDEIGLFERFVGCRQLDLGDDKPLVVAVELVDLEGVTAVRAVDEEACLVDDARLTELEQLLCLLGRNLLLELIAGESAIERGTLDGEVAAAATEAHPDGTSVAAADIALCDAVGSIGLAAVVIAHDQELPLNLHGHALGDHVDRPGGVAESEDNQRADDPHHYTCTFLLFFLCVSSALSIHGFCFL